jgi:hypothetical protein
MRGLRDQGGQRRAALAAHGATVAGTDRGRHLDGRRATRRCGPRIRGWHRFFPTTREVQVTRHGERYLAPDDLSRRHQQRNPKLDQARR